MNSAPRWVNLFGLLSLYIDISIDIDLRCTYQIQIQRSYKWNIDTGGADDLRIRDPAACTALRAR